MPYNKITNDDDITRTHLSRTCRLDLPGTNFVTLYHWVPNICTAMRSFCQQEVGRKVLYTVEPLLSDPSIIQIFNYPTSSPLPNPFKPVILALVLSEPTVPLPRGSDNRGYTVILYVLMLHTLVRYHN